MMTKEKYWLQFRERNRQGTKTHSFVLRGAAPPKNAKVLFFYVSTPVKAVDGYAEFVERKLGTPGEAWEKFGHESVLQSKKSYEELVGNPLQVSFIRFQNLKTANNPVPLSNLRMLRGVNMLSTKGFYVDKNMPAKIIS